INTLEAQLFHTFNPQSQLMNGTVPPEGEYGPAPAPAQIVQVMPEAEIHERQEETQRLPRQAAHYAQLVGHFLAVKNSPQIARAMDAHFGRLQKYHRTLLGLTDDQADEGHGPD